LKKTDYIKEKSTLDRAMWEEIKNLLLHPHLVRLFALFVGLYILRDVARTILYIFDSSRRIGRRRHRPQVPEPPEVENR
jgi:hypothetical protein